MQQNLLPRTCSLSSFPYWHWISSVPYALRKAYAFKTFRHIAECVCSLPSSPSEAVLSVLQRATGLCVTWCASTGNCTSHGSYTRSIVDFTVGKAAYGEVCVLRLPCNSCRHTHAVLPDSIIPYPLTAFSLSCPLQNIS